MTGRSQRGKQVGLIVWWPVGWTKITMGDPKEFKTRDNWLLFFTSVNAQKMDRFSFTLLDIRSRAGQQYHSRNQ